MILANWQDPPFSRWAFQPARELIPAALIRHGAGPARRNVSFVQADAQAHRFRPGCFDLAISRFGTMFFADPVAASTNIGRALRPGGRLVQLVW